MNVTWNCYLFGSQNIHLAFLLNKISSFVTLKKKLMKMTCNNDFLSVSSNPFEEPNSFFYDNVQSLYPVPGWQNTQLSRWKRTLAIYRWASLLSSVRTVVSVQHFVRLAYNPSAHNSHLTGVLTCWYFYPFQVCISSFGLKLFWVGKQRLLLQGCLCPPSPSEPSLPCSAGKWIELGKEMSVGESGMFDKLLVSILFVVP